MSKEFSWDEAAKPAAEAFSFEDARQTKSAAKPARAPARLPEPDQPAAFGIYARSGRDAPGQKLNEPPRGDRVRSLMDLSAPPAEGPVAKLSPISEQLPSLAVKPQVPRSGQVIEPWKETAESRRMADVAAQTGTMGPVGRGIRQGIETMRQYNVGPLRFIADMVGAEDASDRFGETMAKSERTLKAIGEAEGFWARAAESAISSMVGNVQGLAVGVGAGMRAARTAGGGAAGAVKIGAAASRAALTTMGVQTFGDEYSASRDALLSVGEATTRGAMMAAAEVIGERLGLGKFAPALTQALRGVGAGELPGAIAKYMLAQQGGEQLTLAMQSLTDKISPVGITPELGLAQYLQSMADTAAATLIQTAAMGGGGKAASMAMERLRGGKPAPSEVQSTLQPMNVGIAPGAPAASMGTLAPGGQVAATGFLPPEGLGAKPAPVADSSMTYQNRDRSTAASVTQMQKIAQAPDYDLVGPAKTPDVGAPLVAVEAMPEGAALGREDTVTLPNGTKLPTRYAVVEADTVQPSNFADGTKNADYDAAPVRALSNARTAGIRAAYPAGTATGYRAGLEADTSHGVPVEQIRGMKHPMLVRVMDRARIEGIPDFARQSNSGGSASMGARETAMNDAGAIGALDDLETSDDGAINIPANRAFVKRFVGALPENDRATVMDKDGRLTPGGETDTPSKADILNREAGNELRDPAQELEGAQEPIADSGTSPPAVAGAVGTGGQTPVEPETGSGTGASAPVASDTEQRAIAALDRATASINQIAQRRAQKEREDAAEKEKAEKQAEEEAEEDTEEDAPRVKKPPKKLDPSRDDYASLVGKTLTRSVEMDGGKKATLRVDAAKAMRDFDRRKKTLEALQTCLGRAA